MIKLEKINKIYSKGKPNQVHALKNANLIVNKGEMVAITGPSGSGKSTLLHIIAGIDKPTSGKYFLNGNDIASLNDVQIAKIRNKEIGIVLQDFGLLGDVTVYKNVALPMLIANEKNKTIKQQVKAALENVGIYELVNKKVNELSGGQKQRVAVARALVMNAELILADEPTGALDTKNSSELVNLLQGLNEKGVTVVIVTHNLSVAEKCARQIKIVDGILSEG